MLQARMRAGQPEGASNALDLRRKDRRVAHPAFSPDLGVRKDARTLHAIPGCRHSNLDILARTGKNLEDIAFADLEGPTAPCRGLREQQLCLGHNALLSRAYRLGRGCWGQCGRWTAGADRGQVRLGLVEQSRSVIQGQRGGCIRHLLRGEALVSRLGCLHRRDRARLVVGHTARGLDRSGLGLNVEQSLKRRADAHTRRSSDQLRLLSEGSDLAFHRAGVGRQISGSAISRFGRSTPNEHGTDKDKCDEGSENASRHV